MNVLIMGGASGLGEAITRRIAQDTQCTVYFTFCKSKANAKKIETDFPNVFSIKCDFKDEQEVNTLKEKINGLGIDVLVNNAYSGTFLKSYFHKIPPEDFLTEFKENIIPSIIITQAAISCFRKKRFGKIITILSSALVNVPPVGSSVYVANKAYMEELSKVWATENAKYNITSNAVSPAFMLTKFTSETDERLVEQMIENHPLKKLLTTEEVAETIFYLLHASQQINGTNIILNAATSLR